MIEAFGLVKSYGERAVLEIASASVRRGEVLVVLGPSGSGKSVFLRLLNLLEEPTCGRILLEGREVQHLPRKERVQTARRMTMLFQEPLLFRGTVLENVCYGLKVRRVPAGEARRRADEALALVGLDGFSAKHVSTLSGGEAQRVALARALVIRPELVFLDEPFAGLDRLRREELQGEVKRIIRSGGYSAVFVTHDQEEAARMGDRLILLDRGRIVQEGTAAEVFRRPATEFAARFVGMENIFRGVVSRARDGYGEVSLGDGVVEVITDRRPGEEVLIGLRPEDVTLTPGEGEGTGSSRNVFRGRVAGIEHRGPVARVEVECPFLVIASITRRSLEEMGLQVGSPVTIRFKVTATQVI